MIAMVAKFKYYLGIILGMFALIGYAFLSGRKSGKQEVQTEVKDKEIADTKAAAAVEVTASTSAKEITQNVSRNSDSAVDNELSKFTRD